MEEELISKKDLLERYGISYGALYRWKRKGLIPEEWFIKKATVTGQETFFPKELICERVELIQNQKDDFSLDELSKQFHEESEAKAVLTVKTLYGNKQFYLNEIQAVLLDDGKGEVKDVTKEVMDLLDEKERR
jgi:predicted site-specific integrase-resolvase